MTKQIVGSHNKVTTDSVCILAKRADFNIILVKKTDFNRATIFLACLSLFIIGGRPKVYNCGGIVIFLSPK